MQKLRGYWKPGPVHTAEQALDLVHQDRPLPLPVLPELWNELC